MASVWQQFVDIKTGIDKRNSIIVLRTHDKTDNARINVLKRSIRRAWTINGLPDYWDAVRKSTTIRIYRSLPLNRNERKKIQDSAERNLSIQTLGVMKKDSPIVVYHDDSKRKEKTLKYGERRSNIPIFRRNSQEFEDLCNLREQPKRSTVTTIPQRYRGSADDLRRYRDDSNLPSHIPKLLISSRHKENKMKKLVVESKEHTAKLSIYPKSSVKKSNTMSTTVEQDYTKIGDKSLRSKLVTNETIVFNNSREHADVLNLSVTPIEREAIIDIVVEEQPFDVNNVHHKCDSENVAAGKSQQIDEPLQRKHLKDELLTEEREDETRTRRPSSHLSPEASPLSTRSSKYSPRESESEPTPGLPRKISGSDTCVSSQRIRDAITRTRRESNSSTRCESSGSDSIRLSESSLHDYTDLARRVRLFGNNYYCPRTTSVESDELVPRDSATSAGEDESHEDCLLRDPSRYPSASSSSSSQGRTMLRRRRQFDSQGSRRRGKSHARSCCSDEFLNLQIARHPSPLRSGYKTIDGQEPPNPDYRRLVFISSDSSSGREEDDADSSCSSSSYLNGLPRNSHAQSLEDCDWDYFESNSLPLPSALSDGLRSHYTAAHVKDSGRDWDCCLGRGSGACLACGGSPGRNVLPVPVPIPVPVPYPVPIPASLWTHGNFVAAESSMIAATTTTTTTTTIISTTTVAAATTTTAGNEASLTVKNIPTAAVPWFTWHPRFHQPEVHGASGGNRMSSRFTANAFDPSNFTFQYYGTIQEYKNFILSASESLKFDNEKMPDIYSRDLTTTTTITTTTTSTTKTTSITAIKTMMTTTTTMTPSTNTTATTSGINCHNVVSDEKLTNNLETESFSKKIEILTDNVPYNENNDDKIVSINDNLNSNDILEPVNENLNDDNYCVSRSDWNSSSGRSSADSSDFEESSSHRFSRIFVVNDDSLVSDNDDVDDIEDIHGLTDENQAHEATTSIDDSYFHKRVITLSDEEPIILQQVKSFCKKQNVVAKCNKNEVKHVERSEIYIGDSIDTSDSCVKLQSIRSINPDEANDNYSNIIDPDEFNMKRSSGEMKSFDSSVTPDSLELIDAITIIDNDTLEYKSMNILDEQMSMSLDTSKEIEKIDDLYTNVDANKSTESTKADKKIEIVPMEFFSVSQAIDSAKNKIITEIVSEDENMKKCEFTTTKIPEIYREIDNINSIKQKRTITTEMTIERGVKGEIGEEYLDGQQVRESQHNGGVCCGGNNTCDNGGKCVATQGMARYRSVERRPPTRKENVLLTTISNAEKDQSTNITNNLSTNNKYKSLVMITQDGYQPVSVVTTNTTTLTLQSSDVESTQGLAGYYHLALEALTEPQLRKGQGPRRPLMVKRTTTALITNNEHETDSGLSVGSASESESSTDKYRVINKDSKNRIEDEIKFSVEKSSSSSTSSVLPQSNETNGLTGIVILEEGLADDDSWVEEVSHDEDEQSATTATEESSEDESNNIGDREEELRGYHRQAIDFTLHTIVEESCEESEAEPSLGSKNSRRIRPPSASDLEKYFFFGLGGDNINNSSTANRNGDSNMNLNNGNSIDNGKSGIAQEVDSLSETSSVYSEVLESLGQDDLIFNKETTNDDFSNSSRLEKYFLSEFLGFDKDRRDSDGSVGSDSEGRPSPEAQRRKRLVRARGTGRSHSSSLDNLLALTQSNQNLSTQNSQQDLSMNQDSQDTQSEDSSTENDGMDDGQTAVFGADGQYDTVKRKKKKPRNLGSQSPRIVEDRNKSPEIRDGSVKSSETSTNENDIHLINSDDCRDDNENGNGVGNYSDHIVNELNENNDVINGDVGAEDDSKISESEALHAVSIANTSNASSSSHADDRQNVNDSALNRNKQQLRDSGFIGSCDDLLHPKSSIIDSKSDGNAKDLNVDNRKTRDNSSHTINKILQTQNNLPPPIANTSLSRKDSFNNWSSDEETNLMMSKMRQFFKTMVANSNGSTTPVSNNSNNNNANNNSSAPSPLPSPRSSEYTSAKSRHNRTKPPQLVYFENELTRLMKTVPGIRDDQVREIVEYLSSEDTWSDSYDSSDYTSSDLEGAAGGRRSALQEQISQSCQQIINKFNIASNGCRKEEEISLPTNTCVGRDTAFVYQKLVQSFTKIASDSVSSDASSTPHSSPPLIAKVMHHIGSRLVALMHQVSEGNSSVPQHSSSWRRYSQHHRAPSSASTTEDDDSTSDSPHTPSSNHFQLPRSKSHDPLLYINGHPATTVGQEGEEREASDYERFSWRGSFESALMTADSRTKLSLLACSGDINASASVSALAMAAKRRSAGDLLFNPKSFSREQLDRVRSCGSIGGGNSPVVGAGTSTSAVTGIVGSIGEKIWSNHRRSSVPDANTRGGSGASAGDDDTEDELEYPGDPKATTLPRGLTAISSANAATNSLPRLPVSNASATSSTIITHSPMHKAQSMYHFLPQHTGVKSARYRPPGFARNSSNNSGVNSAGNAGPKRAFSAPGLQIAGSHNQQLNVKRDREISRSRRREQTISLMPDDGGSLSEACSTPIIGGTSPRLATSRTIIDIDDVEHGGIHSSVHHHGNHANTRASLSNLGARSDSLASVYSGAGEGRWCGSVAVRGEVEFSLQYDYKQLTFQVHVNQCKDLAPVDIKRNRSDPYVKVYLLPDKSKGGKRKTKVKKHTLNPVFDETLKFHMNLNGLETRTLWLTVWHSDMFGRNDFLGEVRMSLENKIFDDPTPRWYPLQERTEPFYDPITYKGEVIVGLKFVPPDPTQSECEREVGSLDRASIGKSKKNLNRGALHVLVKEARNLQTRTKNSGTCDPFCKSYLLPDKGRAGKQKTHVVRRSGGSPVWNHTFIYKNVSLQELAERGLELTVWDHDRIASNEFLGGVRFNLGTGKNYGKSVDWMDATGRELSLWQSMLERPNFWVEGAVTLRPNLHNHGRNSAP